MKTATFIKDLEQCDTRVSTNRSQKLWRVDEHFVVTSAACVMGESETYVFPSDENGKVTDWGELDGSFKGDLDHGRAIEGYVAALNEAAS